MTDPEDQERQAESERIAREADRKFEREHRDGDPPPAAKGRKR